MVKLMCSKCVNWRNNMEENKIRNKILAISGQPVTGKGTNIKAIIEKLKQIRP